MPTQANQASAYLDLTTRIVLHPRATRLLTLQFSSSSSSSSTSFKQQLVRFASVSAMHAWSGLSAVCLPSVFYRGSWSETRSNWSHVSATLRIPYKTCGPCTYYYSRSSRATDQRSDGSPSKPTPQQHASHFTSARHTRGHAQPNIVLTFLCLILYGSVSRLEWTLIITTIVSVLLFHCKNNIY